ncbi:hypothetical protein [Carnobacterium maltaromaticum]|uniref:hypothetical protein n=1 Tax=Carnobacterium maltaromaticum TaxID=2751 RepID=UPI0039B0C1D0
MTDRDSNYSTYTLVGGFIFGAGLTCGYQIAKLVQKKKVIHGDEILDTVKNLFLEEGPIEGSWIELKRVPLRKFAFKTEVYYGGVSRIEEDQLMQYEFIADAHTGSILDLYRI